MSKGSLFWGTARGKLGEAVFYRQGGEQRNRSYVAKIKNPRTLAQVSNRLSMKNFVTIFRLLQPVLANSFTLRKENQSGYNAFLAANKSVNSPVNSDANLEQGIVGMDEFVVSNGTLMTDAMYHLGNDFIGFRLGTRDSHPLFAEIFGDTTTSAARELSVEQLSQVFEAIGLSQRAVVTCIGASYVDEGWRLGYMSNSMDGVAARGSLLGEKDLYMALIQESSGSGSPVIYLGLQGVSADGFTCGAVIISDRDANGQIVATNSSFKVGDEGKELFAEWKRGGDVWNQILEMKGYNANSVLVADSAQGASVSVFVENPDPSGIEITGAGKYKVGDSVTLEAKALGSGAELTFNSWKDVSGNVVSRENPYTFVVKSQGIVTLTLDAETIA